MNAQQSLEKARRLSDQPEYVQIAEVNRRHMLGEISEAERLRRIFAIRAEFSNDVNAIMEIR